MTRETVWKPAEIGLPDWLSVTLDSIFTAKTINLMGAAGPAWRGLIGFAPAPAANAIGLVDIFDAYKNGTSWDVQQQWQGFVGSFVGGATVGSGMAAALGPFALTPVGMGLVGAAGVAGAFGGEKLFEGIDARAASARVFSLNPGAPNYPYMNPITGQGTYFQNEYVVGWDVVTDIPNPNYQPYTANPSWGQDAPSEHIEPSVRLEYPDPLNWNIVVPHGPILNPPVLEPYILDTTTIPQPLPPAKPFMLDPIHPMMVDPAAPLVSQFTPPVGATPLDLRPNVVAASTGPDQSRPGGSGGGSSSSGGSSTNGGSSTRVGTGVGGRGEDRNERGSNGYGAGNYGDGSTATSNSRGEGSGSLGSSSANGGRSGEYARTPSEGPTPSSRPDRSFPGKDKDDRDVGRAPSSRPERSFPGKDKDDRDVGRSPSARPERSFPGKDKDDRDKGRGRGEFRGTGPGTPMVPVLLDLTGNGLDINPLGSSSKFLETNGDGYERRTAWAGEGNGVLVIDLGGDGKITEEKELAFAQWDPAQVATWRR